MYQVARAGLRICMSQELNAVRGQQPWPQPARPPGEADLMSKPTILAVDDDPDVSAAITRDLRGRYATGYRIVRATSGPKAPLRCGWSGTGGPAEVMTSRCSWLATTCRTGGTTSSGTPRPGGCAASRGRHRPISRPALEQVIIGKAADRLSGPGGLASFLMRTPPARRAAGRAEPAAGHRVQQGDPAGHPQRRDPAGPAVPVARRLPPARPGLRSAPRHAPGARRRHQPQTVRAVVQLPPPDRDPPMGLDPGTQPGRHHHRLEPRPDQSAAQPQPSRPRRGTTRAHLPSEGCG